MNREFPTSVMGPYEPPPREFTDKQGRTIEIHRFDGEVESLIDMYVQFNPEDRAQGIPPSSEDRITSWIENLLREECINVVAWYGNEIVGHATLVPDQSNGYELAIFVIRDYQESGIGTELIKALLGAGYEDNIKKVWLSVERWNDAAINLYRKVGFEPMDSGSFELEMAGRIRES